ncbi:GAF domain-containing protein [Archangium violaceum]|uniref:GAF domain-containing protein n=1 Tax=Archangium violaceum TaxID=83451 RepID=UPI00193B4A18|nr:GAF domain-containing protein [Archangium violaceum]QRK11795.1 GAF domain-containing protein [Archangium violaceum]
MPDAERLTLLADASHQLAEAGLEPPAVLERLCALVVPRLGTTCHVRLLSEDGLWLNPVTSAHAESRTLPLLRHLATVPLRADEHPLAELLRTGGPLFCSPEELARSQHPERHAPGLAPLTSAHLLLLPLRARQRSLGTLTVLRGLDEPPFEKAELLLLQGLVERAGLALDVARAYESERRARHAAEVAAERLARMQRVTEALCEAISPADVARVIVEEMSAAIGADRALAVAPMTDVPGQLEVVGHRNLPPRTLAHPVRFPTTAPLPVARAYREGEPVWVESREELAASSPESLVAEPAVTRAVAALPLRLRGRTLGAIAFGFDTARTFSPDERGLLLDLARQSAQALERAWLYETARQARTRAERVAARTARLQTLNAALSQVLTVARVAEVVIDQGVAAIGAQVACLWLLDASHTHARLLRGVGLQPEVARTVETLMLGQGTPLDDALQHGQPVLLESQEEFARRYPMTERNLSELAPASPPLALAFLPLRVDERDLGVLALGFPGVHRFDDDERVFLSLLAHHAAQALDRARLFAQEREAREALRDAHLTLEAIIQASPMAISLLELDGTVRLWNPAAERIFDWKAEEVLGRPTPIVSEDKREELRDNLAHIARGGSILARETLRIRRDGTPIHISLWATSVSVVGGRQLCLCMMADITERKRTEEALRFLAAASNALASSLDHEVTLERVAHLAVPTYADGCFVYLLGGEDTVSCVATASSGELLEPPREMGPLAPGESAISRVITSGRPELCADCTHRPFPSREDPYLPCEAAARSYLCVPLRVRGQTIGAMSFVSSRHSYDPQDLALAQELAQRAALAIDNARHYRDARDAIRLREEFLAIASHELRTPVTALLLQVQRLQGALARDPQALSPERLRHGLEVVDRQVKRQMSLVNDLLDVSRLGEGRLAPRPEPLELTALVRDVVTRFEPELARTGSLLALRAPAPVPGSWDRPRLEQVVTNLVSNAVKYGQGNPIDITVEAGEGRAHIIVRDAGIGIAPEHLERVFGRFERAVSERHYGGFGLGLWIAREILEAMGGRITVSSQLGVGSTFRVELPRTRS